MKWNIATQERNALVETHLGCIWWTINKNRRLISAAGLDDEDVFQQLAVRMIRAVENYDPDKGKDLEQHIFAQLQYEVLNCKDAAKLYGVKGAPYGARGLVVSLDAMVENGRRPERLRTTPFPFCQARSAFSPSWACGRSSPTWPARSTTPAEKGGSRVKYKPKTLTAVQVGQVVKALVLLGARKIIVEEVEKDRFVVTTTTETAQSTK